MWRFLFIAFLIAHGGVHLAMWITPVKADAAFNPSHSWLVGDQRGIAIIFAVAAASLLIVSGIGLWVGGSWWRPLAVVGLAASFLLMSLFFHPWFIPIQIINAGLIIALLWLDWPSRALVGA